MGNCIKKENNKSIDSKLEFVTYENTSPVTYDFNRAKVVKVYDGDTFTIAVYYCNKLTRFQVRLYGVDCPEIKGGTEESKAAARVSKQHVEQLILNKIVNIEILNNKIYNGKRICEKYGRLLAIVTIGDINLADYLIKNKLGLPYFGGKKDTDNGKEITD